MPRCQSDRFHQDHVRVRCYTGVRKELTYPVGLGAQDDDNRTAATLPQHADRAQQPRRAVEVDSRALSAHRHGARLPRRAARQRSGRPSHPRMDQSEATTGSLIIILIIVGVLVEGELLQDRIMQPTIRGVAAGAQRPGTPIKISEFRRPLQ